MRKSGVHGRGVYATKAIPKGTRIIEYAGKRVLWESIPEDSEDRRTFLFGLQNGKDVIDPTIGGNEAQNNGLRAASIGITNTFATEGVTAINLQGYSSFGRANGAVGRRVL